MRFFLLATFLFFATNTYGAVLNHLYVYPDDTNEGKAIKEQLKAAKDKFGELRLRSFKNNRNTYPDKDEVVYRVGDISKKDISAKIGMTTDQVLNKTYWGKPDRSYIDIDGNDKIELWIYDMYGERKQISSVHGLLFFINGRLTNRVY